MSEGTRGNRRPLVLIANHQEWSARSLESILGPGGFDVVKTYTAEKALERVETADPDIVILDANLGDMDGLTLCKTLRGEGRISDSTPIIMTAPDRPQRRLRLAALEAGAWDVLSLPVDGEEFTLRLNSYLRAKLDADRAREDALVDNLTGLYTVRGLEQRARDLAAHAFRNRKALACVVIAPELRAELGRRKADEVIGEVVARIAEVFKSTARLSDIVGRLGKTEFAIIAPDTNAAGATQLAKRLAEAAMLSYPDAQAPDVNFRAGYEAVPDYHEKPIEPVDLLVHATTALRMARQAESRHDGSWIRPFEERFSSS
jgi:diguanylate cyclase (GGDEF)-like protein